MIVVVDWIDGTRTWERTDMIGVSALDLDWAVETVTILFEK